jgi:putative nucleotidyltransferase with HDIG domain
VGERSAPRLKRYLPHAVAATAVVIVLPIGVVSLLVSGGLIDSMVVSGPVAMLISLGASSAGSAWWKKRRASHELVFSDLMLWGWLRRLRNERRISRAVELLGNTVELPTEQQVEYFKRLAGALEARDPYTHGHTRRVTAHAVAIAKQMGLSREKIAKVRTAAAIHDIGKLNTPREVLNKPGRLNDDEFAVIKRHPVDGAEMAAQLGDAEITAMVLHHHERLDGTGYPSRLAGEAIPLGARIIAVADTFDAITSKRPYRGASSHKKGMAILTKEAGAQLDPDAVKAFRSHYSGLRGVAIGSLVSSGPGQLLPWRWGLSSVAPLAKGIAAVAVAGALGTTAAGLAKPTPARHSRPVRTQELARVTSAGSARHSDRTRSSALVHVERPRVDRTSRRRTTVSHHGSGASPAHPISGTAKPVASPSGGSASPASPLPGAGTAAPDRTAAATSNGGASAPHGGGGSGSGAGGGAGASNGGGSSTTVGPVSVSTNSPPVSVSQGTVNATTPSVTVSTPSVTVPTPVAPVKTPPVTVTTPSVTVSTPSVHIGQP